MRQILESFPLLSATPRIQFRDWEFSLKTTLMLWTKTLILTEAPNFKYLTTYSPKGAVLGLPLTLQKNLTITRTLQTVQGTYISNQINPWVTSKQIHTLVTAHTACLYWTMQSQLRHTAHLLHLHVLTQS